ncbi:flagellar assembly protein FliH [Niallia sp. 03133]|uniref:flagellar assembly protein FliH n=1 Tax=Niallia sp. 03133 TaxID=3458060 RepID=UPI004044283B
MSRLIKSKWANQDQSGEKVISIKYLESFEGKDYSSNVEYQKIVQKANQEANQLLKDTYDQIEYEKEKLLSEQQCWENEKQQLIEEAKANGYQIGLEQGRNNGYEEYRNHIQLAKEVIDSSKNDYHTYLQSAEKTILQLGVKVAEKIISKTISADNEHFLEIVKKVLKESKNQKDIELHVHPNHFQYVLSEKEELLNLFPMQPNLFIFPNESISENGCLIETANGRIDANIDTQLKMIKQKLLDLLESE